jgi:hypothetical protein
LADLRHRREAKTAFLCLIGRCCVPGGDKEPKDHNLRSRGGGRQPTSGTERKNRHGFSELTFVSLDDWKSSRRIGSWHPGPVSTDRQSLGFWRPVSRWDAQMTLWSSDQVGTRPGPPKSTCAPVLRRENAPTAGRIPGGLVQRSAGRLGRRRGLGRSQSLKASRPESNRPDHPSGGAPPAGSADESTVPRKVKRAICD